MGGERILFRFFFSSGVISAGGSEFRGSRVVFFSWEVVIEVVSV